MDSDSLQVRERRMHYEALEIASSALILFCILMQQAGRVSLLHIRGQYLLYARSSFAPHHVTSWMLLARHL